ncbi:MAG: hypothetical protein IMZ64_09345 [Bacteroidetes bacterium]|nr:hypothetical protein [Bacteroidota bacterium]
MAIKHEMITLSKNGVRRDFAPRAAKIAQDLYGWCEIVKLGTPIELKTKIPKSIPTEIKSIPTEILKLIELKPVVKEVVPEKKEEVPVEVRKEPVILNDEPVKVIKRRRRATK